MEDLLHDDHHHHHCCAVSAGNEVYEKELRVETALQASSFMKEKNPAMMMMGESEARKCGHHREKRRRCPTTKRQSIPKALQVMILFQRCLRGHSVVTKDNKMQKKNTRNASLLFEGNPMYDLKYKSGFRVYSLAFECYMLSEDL